jgi:hypothetical protein
MTKKSSTSSSTQDIMEWRALQKCILPMEYIIWLCDPRHNSKRVSCNIPIGNGSFTISLLDKIETALMTTVPEYQILLYFEVSDLLHPDLLNS